MSQTMDTGQVLYYPILWSLKERKKKEWKITRNPGRFDLTVSLNVSRSTGRRGRREKFISVCTDDIRFSNWRIDGQGSVEREIEGLFIARGVLIESVPRLREWLIGNPKTSKQSLEETRGQMKKKINGISPEFCKAVEINSFQVKKIRYCSISMIFLKISNRVLPMGFCRRFEHNQQTVNFRAFIGNLKIQKCTEYT